MKLQKIYSALALSLPLYTAFAGTMGPVAPPALLGYEVLGGGGWANIDISDAYIHVTSDERDTLANNSDDWNSGIGQLGIGMVVPFMQNYSVFNTARVQLNGYYTSEDLHGPIYRFGDPSFSDYRYKMSIKSTRLIIDGLLDVFSISNFSLYAKGGIGAAWNRVNYREAEALNNGIRAVGNGVDFNKAVGLQNFGGCSSNTLNFHKNNSTKFAVEGGGGIRYDFNERIAVSAEYLYAHIGKISTGSGAGSACISSVSPINFKLNVQSAILALHYTFA
ncbi:outer membrane protein [Legionella gresilensis]|uniref:outer membrane protein n=1 Tax=Legionella gresilensis TaxID=91823 RepID=UPI001041AA00|nr:hypothetical protein [Legionella gresilensis]